jgi:hypothetical protein
MQKTRRWMPLMKAGVMPAMMVQIRAVTPAAKAMPANLRLARAGASGGGDAAVVATALRVRQATLPPKLVGQRKAQPAMQLQRTTKRTATIVVTADATGRHAIPARRSQAIGRVVIPGHRKLPGHQQPNDQHATRAVRNRNDHNAKRGIAAHQRLKAPPAKLGRHANGANRAAIATVGHATVPNVMRHEHNNQAAAPNRPMRKRVRLQLLRNCARRRWPCRNVVMKRTTTIHKKAPPPTGRGASTMIRRSKK